MRKDVARNRALLLAAANEVYCQRGANATLDEIAQHAGVGVATAYRHFENKQALLAALFLDRINTAQRILEDAEKIVDPREALETFLYKVCGSQANDAGLREAMASNIGLKNAEEVRERLAPIAIRILNRARAAGLLREQFADNDIHVVFSMISAVQDYAGPPNPELWRRYLQVLIDGFYHESVPRRPLAVEALDDVAVAKAMGDCASPRLPSRSIR